MWYGNASITTSQQNIPGVWSNNYLSVFHFGSGATAGTSDSGIAGYNLQGSANSGPGVIGGVRYSQATRTISLLRFRFSLPIWRFACHIGGMGSGDGKLSEGSADFFGYGSNAYDGARVALAGSPSNVYLDLENIGLTGCWHKMPIASHRWRLRRQSYRSIRRPAICGRYVNSDQRCYRNAIDFNRRIENWWNSDGLRFRGIQWLGRRGSSVFRYPLA